MAISGLPADASYKATEQKDARFEAGYEVYDHLTDKKRSSSYSNFVSGTIDKADYDEVQFNDLDKRSHHTPKSS